MTFLLKVLKLQISAKLILMWLHALSGAIFLLASPMLGMKPPLPANGQKERRAPSPVHMDVENQPFWFSLEDAIFSGMDLLAGFIRGTTYTPPYRVLSFYDEMKICRE